MKIAVHCITWTYLAAVFQLCEKAASFCNRLVKKESDSSCTTLPSFHFRLHIQSLFQPAQSHNWITLVLSTLSSVLCVSLELQAEKTSEIDGGMIGWLNQPSVILIHWNKIDWWFIHSIQWWDSVNHTTHMYSSNPPTVSWPFFANLKTTIKMSTSSITTATIVAVRAC